MQERRIAKELQLEGKEGRQASHLELQNTGETVEPRWQLRDTQDAGTWQPVEYTRPTPTEPNWILPSLVGLVLLLVSGYMVYIGLNRISSISIPSIVPVENSAALVPDENTNTSAEQPVAVVPQVEDEPTATDEPIEEPTVTPVPTEPPTPEPTAALIEQQVAVITNQFGVNARLAPSTTAEVLRILEEGESVIVLGEQEATDIEGNWLQVRTSEDVLVWISSQFAEVSTQFVTAEPSRAAGAVPSLEISVTISSPAGLNARAEPDSASEIVTLLPDNSSYPAISQSADGQWIEILLENGNSAWIFLQLVSASRDLTDLPIFQPAVQEVTDSVEDETPALDSTESIPDEPLADASNTESEEIGSSDTVTETASPVDNILPALTETEAVTGTLTGTEGSGEAEAGTAPDSSEVGSALTADDEATDSEASQPQVSTTATISVTSTFGVNARSTSSTDAEVLVVLEEASETSLRGRNEDGSWVQVILDDGRLAWVFAQAVELSVALEELPVFAPPAVGTPAETLSDAEVVPANDPSAAADDENAAGEGGTETGAIAGSDAETDAAEETLTEAIAPAATATVTSILGAKARSAPTTEEQEFVSVPFNTELPVIGRSEDSEWLQVQLENGDLAWLLVGTVEVDSGVADLAVVE
ncbi:MAG: SH3 domain-containing protein [Chloroflexota bacterium]